MKNRPAVLLAAFVIVAMSQVSVVQAGSKEVTVYKSPLCGCCGGWVEYMRNAGYSVRVQEMEDVTPIKEFLRIDEDLWSCHTAVTDGYVVEGHVTLGAVERLLSQKPQGVRGNRASRHAAGQPRDVRRKGRGFRDLHGFGQETGRVHGRIGRPL